MLLKMFTKIRLRYINRSQ